MKKTLGLFLVLLVGIQKLVYAQTGIGTNSPNEQAVLEIQSVDKGVLFPSISLTSTTTFLGGISATASHTNMLVYNTNTATTTTGLDGAGYYFWNGSNWEKITGDTDDQSLAEVTAIGNTTNDVIAVGGVLDSGALTVVGDADLQGNVDLGDTYLDNVSILGTINTDLLFQAGKNVASPTSALVAVYSSELKPGSGDDLSIDTNSTSERINFSNNGVITAGVNSSTLFVGDISGPNHYKLPSGTASRASGQVLTVDSSTENLYFSTIPTLPASFDDGATLRWNLSATEWEATTDFRIAPGTGYSLPNAIWIEESIIPSSTINLGQSGNEFNQTYTEEVRTSTNVLALTTNAQSVYLKRNTLNFSLTNNQDSFPAGFKGNIGFGIDVFNPTATTPNNNVAVGYNVLESLTTGSNNIAFGSGVLSDITTGIDNVAIGNGAGNNLATASQTIVIGRNAGSLLTGSNNIGLGFYALYGAPSSTGFDNIGIGQYALRRVVDGSDNIAVGHNALNNLTTGENNIAIGTRSMETNTTGQKNIVIGAGADVGPNNLENAIAIGYASTVNSSNTIRLGNNDIESVVTSGTLTLDNLTYPNVSGTAGQVLTVSSTTDILYFADASSSTTPTLAEVTTQGSITTNELRVGGLTVSGTIGLSIGESSSQYKLPTRRGTVGQSLVVSSTTGQLEFSSPAYLLASNNGTGAVDMTKINNVTAASGHEVGKFVIVSSNNIQITTTHSASDTIKLPAGRSFKLTAYVAFSSQQNRRINYKFYSRTGTKYIGLEGSTEENSYSESTISLPAVTYVEASNTSVEVGLYVVSYVGSYTSENISNKYTRIEVEEIK